MKNDVMCNKYLVLDALSLYRIFWWTRQQNNEISVKSASWQQLRSRVITNFQSQLYARQNVGSRRIDSQQSVLTFLFARHTNTRRHLADVGQSSRAIPYRFSDAIYERYTNHFYSLPFLRLVRSTRADG